MQAPESQPTAIHPAWQARALLHWVGILFLGFALYDYAVRGWRQEALQMLVLAAVSALVWELFIFGHAVTLWPDRLEHRFLGFPLFLKRSIRREEIVEARQRRGKGRAASYRYVELTVRGHHGPEIIRIPINTFALPDAGKFLRWLGIG